MNQSKTSKTSNSKHSILLEFQVQRPGSLKQVPSREPFEGIQDQLCIDLPLKHPTRTHYGTLSGCIGLDLLGSLVAIQTFVTSMYQDSVVSWFRPAGLPEIFAIQGAWAYGARRLLGRWRRWVSVTCCTQDIAWCVVMTFDSLALFFFKTCLPTVELKSAWSEEDSWWSCTRCFQRAWLS